MVMTTAKVEARLTPEHTSSAYMSRFATSLLAHSPSSLVCLTAIFNPELSEFAEQNRFNRVVRALLEDQGELTGVTIWTDDPFDEGLSGLSPTAKTGEAPVTESSNRTEAIGNRR